ncbi:MAG: M42 family metallopeptidase [Promethearchaeota archaeon]
MRELLRELVLTDAPPGREQDVQRIVIRELEPLVDDIQVDIMGNVIAQVNGATNKTFMLIAHQDEDWALLVTHIDEQGYLRFTRLVGHRWNLLGQRVNIHGTKGKLTGVVGLPAPHLIPVKQQQKGYRPEFDRMFIDCGAKSEEDARSMGFEIGQYVTAEKHFKELVNGRLLGNCFDNRVGLITMIEVLRRIHQQKVEMNVVGVASVQEELGTRGASPATFLVEPDYAIALDVSPTGDHPNIKEDIVPVRLGEGPVLLMADQYHVTSQQLNTWIQEVANAHQLPLQSVALRSPLHFGTDAAAVELVKSGSQVTALLVPTRYFHTTNSLIQYSDLKESVKLLAKCLESLDQLENSG